MDVVADLPAETQAAEPVQQGEALLDHPPIRAQAGAVLDTTTGENRRDVLLADQSAVLVMVIAAVGVDRSGRRRGRPRRSQTGGIASISDRSWVTSLRCRRSG